MSPTPIDQFAYFEDPATGKVVECAADPKAIAPLLNKGYRQVPSPIPAAAPAAAVHQPTEGVTKHGS